MNLRATSSPLVAAVALAAALATTPAYAGAGPTAALPPDVGSDLMPSLVDHLDDVGAATPVRVMVQAGGNLAAAKSAARAAGLVPETSLDEVGIAVAVGTPAQVTALDAINGVTRVDWADETLVPFSETSHEATRAVQVHDGAVDVDGEGTLDGYDGAGTSVAIVDSGTDGTHPQFADENGDSRVKKNVKVMCSDAVPILAGIFVDDPYATADSCTVDATAVNDTDTGSLGGHGTHVTGIAAGGIVTDAAGRELRGGAPGADIVAVSTGATLSVYGGTLGMYWVLRHHDDPCGDGSCAPIVALNNSWGPSGGGDFSADAPQVLVQRALVAEGVTVVWAAGNDGGDGSTTVTNPYSTDPTPGVMSIANYDDANTGSRDNALDASSSRGTTGDPATYPDLSAPGTDITSACRPYLPICATGLDTADPNYNTITGTSMAAPHIAGYVAVLQQIALEQSGQRLSPGAIEDLLVNTAYQFGSRSYETDSRNPDSSTGTSFDAGHGLVDLLAAVERLTGQTAGVPAGETCPVDGRFTDPEGDATGVLGVGTPAPNATGLDITESWMTTDPATSDVTFHWTVSDLPDAPGGLEGTGEYFDVNFSLGGGGYYLGAGRTAEEGESFVLGKFGETGRVSLASGLPGSFDPAHDEITVTLPAAQWKQLGLPGSVSQGEEIAGVSIVARRSLVLVVPDADTATSGCAYTIGAENAEEPNTAPEVTAASVTSSSSSKTVKPGTLLTFSASGSDAEGDTLQYSWNYGDGSTGTGAITEHAYASGGTYTAVVTVTDGLESATRSVTVTVKGKSAR
jgi:subtilisin family serine protease